ncbi:hypothetical protein [Thauera humireducens]|uniref:Uncharacterized protein n=1 Tax=Thauera humireducens TaxID=1134435 RepID=A0A127K3I5_9RHOO|nr:hypothetical protein [Thauera humireducens]AMO36531.1 hypothetical protein AC731_006020 [Thauera humireducens]
MSYHDYPKGAGFGRDGNRRRPGLVDYGFVMENGSRAQRREVVRQLKAAKRAGLPDAAETLAALQANEGRPAHAWRITFPGRDPFVAWAMQGATAVEVRAQFPGARVEVAE